MESHAARVKMGDFQQHQQQDTLVPTGVALATSSKMQIRSGPVLLVTVFVMNFVEGEVREVMEKKPREDHIRYQD